MIFVKIHELFNKKELIEILDRSNIETNLIWNSENKNIKWNKRTREQIFYSTYKGKCWEAYAKKIFLLNESNIKYNDLIDWNWNVYEIKTRRYEKEEFINDIKLNISLKLSNRKETLKTEKILLFFYKEQKWITKLEELEIAFKEEFNHKVFFEKYKNKFLLLNKELNTKTKSKEEKIEELKKHFSFWKYKETKYKLIKPYNYLYSKKDTELSIDLHQLNNGMDPFNKKGLSVYWYKLIFN